MTYLTSNSSNFLWWRVTTASLVSLQPDDFNEQDRRIADICFEIHLLNSIYQSAARRAADAECRGEETVLNNTEKECVLILHRFRRMLNELKMTVTTSMIGLMFKAEILTHLLPRFQSEGSEEYWLLLSAFADEVAVHHSSIAISSDGALQCPPHERAALHSIADAVSYFLTKPSIQSVACNYNSYLEEIGKGTMREPEETYLAQQEWLETQLFALAGYDLRSAVEVVALADVVVHLARQDLGIETSRHAVTLAQKICDKALCPFH